jgi:hypothetical protein
VVLPSGRVAFGSDVVTDSAIPVTAHTFHGGDDPSDEVGDSEARWWDEPGLLSRDIEEMSEHFPQFRLIWPDSSTPPIWVGVIDLGLGANYEIAIFHRMDHGLPAVRPVTPQKRGRQYGRVWVKSPHLYTSGNLCVADGSDWNSSRDTTVTVVAWAAHWHACYQEWFFTGTWPIESYEAEAA